MGTQNAFGEEARNHLLEGAEQLSIAVGKSMGPMGRNTFIDYAPGHPICPMSTRDGVTIARNFYLEGFPDTGNRAVRAASEKAASDAGDGTSAAVVLAYSLFKHGLEAQKIKNVVAVKKEIEQGVEFACAEIDRTKVNVSGDMMKQVATIAVNNDPVLGGLIVDAMRKAGASGLVAVEDSPSNETTIERQEGMQFDEGYLSGAFVNNAERQIVEFQQPVILLIDRTISSLQGLVPLFEGIAKSSNPLLIIAENVVGEALATIVMNKLKGTFAVCAVKLPENLGHRKDLLLDIAAVTGGQAILQELGLDLSKLPPQALGRAAKVVVTSKNTRIIGGFGKKEAIEKRIEEIRGLLTQSPTKLEQERLQERLAKLTGGVTILRLGAQTGIELGDKKARCEDACLATRCALEDGIVVGGGMALARIAQMLPEGIVSKALRRPALQILENAGYGETELTKALTTSAGFNSLTGKYGDLIEMGVIDPAKVIKSSLRNAASVACQMLLTELITQTVEK